MGDVVRRFRAIALENYPKLWFSRPQQRVDGRIEAPESHPSEVEIGVVLGLALRVLGCEPSRPSAFGTLWVRLLVGSVFVELM